MGSCSNSLQTQAHLDELPHFVDIDYAIFSTVDLWCVSLDVFSDLSR